MDFQLAAGEQQRPVESTPKSGIMVYAKDDGRILYPADNTIGNSVRRLLYIVRNPLDVIHLRSIGILNVVANMFDSLTIEQVRLIGSGIPTRIDKVAFLYSDIDELTRNDLSAIAFTHWVSLFIHHDNKPIRKWTLEEMVI